MNMKWNKRIAVLLSLIFIFASSTVAYAHEVPDMDRLCSLTFTMHFGSAIVPGGSLTIYRVGEVVEDDGNYSFQPTGDFIACGESFSDLEHTADMAVRLQTYAAQHSIVGTTQNIDANGNVKFENLQVGLYLVAQWEAAPGYRPIAPFLISLPYYENGTYLYDIVAEPKTEPTPDTPPDNPPDDPPDNPPDDPPDNPPDNPPDTPPDNPPDLPQTGQLWWPVPVLVCAGLLLFVVGVVLNRRKTSNGN